MTVCIHTQLNKLNILSDHLTGNNFDFLPYSPSVAPIDYHLFLHLNVHLGGQRRSNDDAVKMTTLKQLSNQTAVFYEDGIRKLIV